MDIGRTLPRDVADDLLGEVVASKALVESIFGVLSEALIQLDEDHRIVRFSASAERMLGCAAESLIGKPFSLLLHENSEPFSPASAQGLAEPLRASLLLNDSKGAPVSVRAACVALAQPPGFLLACGALQRSAELEQLKNELVSTVSHELKTPLAAIKAYSATLRENPALYESRREEFLGIVEEQADRLGRLIEDMLSVSRVETTQLLRARVPVALDALLDRLLSQLKIGESHPVERRGTSVELSGDPERLADILRNLLENAVKYSPNGGPIEISAQREPDRVLVAVRDRGIGIAQDDLPYVFDRFFRVAQAATLVEGSGLGLYIAQAMARAHGGSIEARSESGRGSTFTLKLPVRA